RFAVVVGSEGEGLSQRWLSDADIRVRIPMRPGIDSLNVAAAAAVAFYVLGSQATAANSAASGRIT
ncbi:MAG TPA: TrmH family RNA methyltransferase, partial [Jiangellaceae bacterium]|nr:TrmH family RNA methyltransferase [Jiangellaceae bacterium]